MSDKLTSKISIAYVGANIDEYAKMFGIPEYGFIIKHMDSESYDKKHPEQEGSYAVSFTDIINLNCHIDFNIGKIETIKELDHTLRHEMLHCLVASLEGEAQRAVAIIKNEDFRKFMYETIRKEDERLVIRLTTLTDYFDFQKPYKVVKEK